MTHSDRGNLGQARTKILIVDDSKLVCDVVTLTLEERGYDVVSVASVFSFAQTLHEENPDLVLVDVNMPAMKGDKLVQIAQKHHSVGCPIVLFSDREPGELERLAKACGAAGFIQKTGNPDILVKSIAAYLTKGKK